MPNRASNQVALGDYVYFFESPAAGMRDCAIMAHAGTVRERFFYVPNGVSVKFNSNPGQRSQLNLGPMRSITSHQTSPMPGRDNLYISGNRCSDQVLGKIMGAHWDDRVTRVEGRYYELMSQAISMNSTLGSWAPHLVLIRNRKFPLANEYIWLSKVIQLVRAHNANVSNFYSFGCRNYGDNLARHAGTQAYQIMG